MSAIAISTTVPVGQEADDTHPTGQEQVDQFTLISTQHHIQ